MVEKQKILIVDDDENIAELISLYLTKECFETHIVHDGESAIKAFEEFKNSFNIPKKLSDYGIKETDLDEISLHSFDDACTVSNPREATMTDIYQILRKIL